MKEKSSRSVELAISLLRTLSQVLDVHPRPVRSEILDSDSSLLRRFRLVDEGRLRPVLIPIGNRGRRA
jgi:hypothetical protein